MEPESQARYDCSECSDTGFRLVETGTTGSRYRHTARPCGCRAEKILKAAMDRVPATYQHCRIDTMRPDPARHPEQVTALRLMELQPLGNFGFSGRPGSGKTHMFWCLYASSAMAGLSVRAATLRSLLNQYQANFGKTFEQSSPVLITAEQLRQNHTKFSLFLDDIDKAKPSEYTMEQLFELVDAATAHGHQLCWTTNLTLAQLEQHFERFDDRFGGAILRRLMDGTNLVEMF